MTAIAGIILIAKWLAKIKQQSDVSCRLCKRAREQRVASTENLQEATYGHIKITFCDGIVTTITAAHHFIWRHLYVSRQGHVSLSLTSFMTPSSLSEEFILFFFFFFKECLLLRGNLSKRSKKQTPSSQLLSSPNV